MCRRLPGDGDGPAFVADDWDAASHGIAQDGQRVIGLAWTGTMADNLREGDIDGHLTLAGLVGLIDPPLRRGNGR